jgi:gas vesicle protein
MSGVSLLGLAVGLAAGAAAGLLAAPMRGAALRAALRSRADSALDRGMTLFEEGRRAFQTRYRAGAAVAPPALPATLGEIAEMHQGAELSSLEGRS